MGQRHNRRRTRPRSRNRSVNPLHLPSHPFSRPVNTCAPAVPSAFDCPEIPAPTWHYGHLLGQKRDRALRMEASTLEAEQYRLFGGVPGDDVGLCYRMLEYFGGLDYIDCNTIIVVQAGNEGIPKWHAILNRSPTGPIPTLSKIKIRHQRNQNNTCSRNKCARTSFQWRTQVNDL
ncbi:uncharacterized protein BO87DRAFT_392277 [Aspergillus neoniger CBS 115656]|uniref:Uncharacterized protein n=1 Tax=Aspergillus neoniger (strain CBS 115656) TaxID=1448310 RepID=A0A318YZG0_ASPNB|nr:hypothetical protein BO87DRAFT_392277 [Aspergillus neoniger CBS 115656]PYH39574.1 hypothetical protein BO87DRAFT_392277 [Aspergillus neoniger CBS 115656]